jgi:putative transposase
LYNAALKERGQAWSKSHKSVTHFDQTKSLTSIRAGDPQGYGALPVNLSRWSLKKVDKAFQAFFRRIEAKRGKGGFPRFKSMHRWRSFGFCEFSGIRLTDGALLFKGMPGRLKLHLHRPLPENASIRSCTPTKQGRAWREANKLVGIDWGVERLATLSTGRRSRIRGSAPRRPQGLGKPNASSRERRMDAAAPDAPRFFPTTRSAPRTRYGRRPSR